MSELANAIADLKEDEVKQIVQDRLASGADPMSIVDECRRGMEIIGQRYKDKEYFLGELIMSGEIFKEAMAVIEPKLKAGQAGKTVARMVLGTAKGDIHNIGKDIAATLLKAAGFEIYDLGTDVAPEAFIDKLKETGAPILGISGMLTPSFESMKQTVQALEAAGLRNKVKVIIGGGIVTEMVRKYVGADAFTDDAPEGVELCRKLAGAVK
ncbi:MAG: cobalamin-dependent protein [Dehalococcoidia bacterium]|nr:cobalamin-dependent protein [Dehalococcoidia bacterium]